MSLKLNSSGGGSVTLQEPSTATNGTLTLPAGTGTVAVNGLSSNIVSGTAQNSTSGTSIDFTSIPSWVKRVTVIFNGVSTSGTSDVIVQLGTTSGFTTSGYLGASMTFVGANNPGSTALTSGFLVRLGGAATATAVRHGTVILNLLGSNRWSGAVNVGLSDVIYMATAAGTISLADVLTQVRINTVGGANTFDAGSINILYEYAMSTLKTNNVQVGQSVPATNNFTLYQPSSPDGTVRLGVGNSGATTLDAVTVTSAGNVTMAGSMTATSITSAVTATTQAFKTSDTTIATTAFVDRLRSLLTAATGSGGGTAVIGDRGCLLSVTAGVTVPANVFAANDTFSIYNNSASNITITQGASLTLRQVGTANTGNRTLAQRGLVTVVFISATEAVISGGGLT